MQGSRTLLHRALVTPPKPWQLQTLGRWHSIPDLQQSPLSPILLGEQACHIGGGPDICMEDACHQNVSALAKSAGAHPSHTPLKTAKGYADSSGVCRSALSLMFLTSDSKYSDNMLAASA